MSPLRRSHHRGFKPRKTRMSRGTAELHRSGNFGSTLKRAKREAGKVSTCKRNPKKALGTAKPREGSQRDLEQKLESLLAKRVKVRDGYQCCQCRFDGAPTYGLLDAGHIYPKGKFPGGKFLVENIVAQCRGCNTRHIRRPERMFLWYQAEHGPEALEELHALVLTQPRKQSIEWLEARIEECEEAIAEMELCAVA